jgi:predicted RNA binding protein YcfA (HicA-like mRNA interferase family)
VAEGWILDRQRGSHAVYVHPEKQEIVVVAGQPGAGIPK